MDKKGRPGVTFGFTREGQACLTLDLSVLLAPGQREDMLPFILRTLHAARRAGIRVKLEGKGEMREALTQLVGGSVQTPADAFSAFRDCLREVTESAGKLGIPVAYRFSESTEMDKAQGMDRGPDGCLEEEREILLMRGLIRMWAIRDVWG